MERRNNAIPIFLFFGLLGRIVISAEIPIERVTAGAEELQGIEREFAQQSAPGRLSILCIDRFADAEQKESFCSLLPEAEIKLETLLDEQETLKKRIEDYTGRDWEELYGKTNIWSTCSRTVLQGRYLQARIRFWQAQCDDSRKKAFLNRVIETCESEQANWRGQEQILQVLAMRQRGEPTDAEQLRVILHQMMLRSDLTEQARDQMLLLQHRFELFSEGPFVEELENLFQTKLEAKEDFEWALEYAFIEFSDSDQKPLQKVMETWPQAHGFVSLLLLEVCTDQFSKQGVAGAATLSPFVVPVICEAAINSRHPERYQPLIAGLARVQGRPIVLLALAEGLAHSQPQQALEYYLKAARLQETRPDSSVEPVVEIAERAARLGCRLYQEDANQYGTAAFQALKVYFDLAGGSADPDIQSAAVGILAEQGQDSQSRLILNQLANSSGVQAVRAKMEMYRIRVRQTKEPKERESLEKEWETWIQSLDSRAAETAGLRREAAIEYVQTLFATPNRENAEKIARFLETEPREGDAGLTYLYVQALSLLDQYGKAVTALASIPMDCQNGTFDLFVLEGFTDRLEEFTYQSSTLMEPPALQKAGQLRGCFKEDSSERDRADLVWAELAARSRSVSGQTGGEIDAILGRFEQSERVEAVRCRAFRRMQQGQWTEAVKAWQAVRSAYEPQDKTEKQRDWHWWRAKYYELLCYSKLPEDTTEDVAHAVGILKVLYEPPAACWDERLKALAGEK